MLSKTLLPVLLLALSLTTPISSAAVRRRSACKPPKDIVKAVPGNTEHHYPDISFFDGSVEGTSVDADGFIYTVDQNNFRALHPKRTKIQPITHTPSEEVKFHLASSRFTRTLGTLFGNAADQSILVTKGDGKYETFVKDADLVQPNDFTIDAD